MRPPSRSPRRISLIAGCVGRADPDLGAEVEAAMRPFEQNRSVETAHSQGVSAKNTRNARLTEVVLGGIVGGRLRGRLFVRPRCLIAAAAMTARQGRVCLSSLGVIGAARCGS